MSGAKTTGGERLPYLIGKLKTPRIAERLTETATSAREGKWSYERFLETLLEAEVFARDASGTRNRIRHAAFPAHKTLEDFDFTAQAAAERFYWPTCRPRTKRRIATVTGSSTSRMTASRLLMPDSRIRIRTESVTPARDRLITMKTA